MFWLIRNLSLTLAANRLLNFLGIEFYISKKAFDDCLRRCENCRLSKSCHFYPIKLKTFYWLLVVTSFLRTPAPDRRRKRRKSVSKYTMNKRQGSGIINSLFDGFTDNTRGYFTSCVVFFRAPQGRGKIRATSKMSASIICENHRIRSW